MGWAPRIRAGFHVPRPTWDPAWSARGLRLRGSHPVPPAFPGRSPGRARSRVAVPQPRGTCPPVWAGPLSLAATHGISDLISSPRGTEMFHFPRSRPAGLFHSAGGPAPDGRGVAPFGHPRINACLPLPGDYRSLPRPSSPRDAKASVVRPYALGRRPPLRAPPRLSRATLLPFSLPRHAVVKDQTENALCGGGLGVFAGWWACLESNRGPRPYQGRALTD